MLGLVAESLRGAENFMQQPFATNSLTVRFVRLGREPSEPRIYHDGYHGVDEMILIRESFPFIHRHSERDRYIIVSAIGKPVFFGLGPGQPDRLAGIRWLETGGPGFLASYVNDLTEIQSLEDRLHQISFVAQEQCIGHGLENIQLLTVPDHSDLPRRNLCARILGEYLLLSLFFAMGESGVSAAVQELYWLNRHVRPDQNDQGIPIPTDLQVFQTFLKHTPPDRENAMRDVYREIHGGFTADPSFTL